MEATWKAPPREPRSFVMLECQCSETDDVMLLTFAPDRGFFEPITGLDAYPAVGKIIAWRYAECTS